MVEEQGGAMTPSSCLFVIFSMKRIDPLLDGMCQNELCLEGTSEAAQKCWPDKNNTKIGILFFQSVFKEF